jgi:hypothetical protein
MLSGFKFFVNHFYNFSPDLVSNSTFLNFAAYTKQAKIERYSGFRYSIQS